MGNFTINQKGFVYKSEMMAAVVKYRIEQSFEKERNNLMSYIKSKINSIEEAEDLLQDVYLVAAQNLNVLSEVDNIAGWLYRVARNKVIDWYRRKKKPVLSIDEPLGEDHTVADFLEDELIEGLDEESRILVYDAILESIEALPDKQKFVFVEQEIEGRSFRELAMETGESINTLLARKRYAVQFLRKRLSYIEELINEDYKRR